jgi:hypothetical protein
MKVHHGCQVQATINVLSGKWKVQAGPAALRRTPQSFYEASAKQFAPRSAVNWKRMAS